MSEELKFEITSQRVLAVFHTLQGVMIAVRCLKENDAKYPGYQQAKALISAEYEKLRADWATESYRLMASKGVDISNMKEIRTDSDGKMTTIECIPYDAEDVRED